MYVLACKTYEEIGAPIPKHRLGLMRPEEHGTRGWLIYKQRQNVDHRRMMMTAQLVSDDGAELFPMLLDADMLLFEDGIAIVKGEQRDPITRALTAMTWWCKVIRLGKRGYQGDSVGPSYV